MGDTSDRDSDNHALRIQTDNLPNNNETSTPTRIPSTRSLNSQSGSYTSSPIITPSGSTLHLPSSTLTPLPSPLVSAGTFPSSLSLDPLVLGTSPRRKGYGVLGVANGQLVDRRNVTEHIPGAVNETLERRVSSGLSGRTLSNDGLRREEALLSRSRTSSVGDEIFVPPFN